MAVYYPFTTRDNWRDEVNYDPIPSLSDLYHLKQTIDSKCRTDKDKRRRKKILLLTKNR